MKFIDELETNHKNDTSFSKKKKFLIKVIRSPASDIMVVVCILPKDMYD